MTVLPLSVDLFAVPKAVPEVRRMLRERFEGEDATDLVLCVSELLTNVIAHVGEGVPVTLRVGRAHTGRIRVELRDPAPAVRPAIRSAGPRDESGRGLLLVDALALRWGVEQGFHGKTVWCEMRAPAETDRPPGRPSFPRPEDPGPGRAGLTVPSAHLRNLLAGRPPRRSGLTESHPMNE